MTDIGFLDFKCAVCGADSKQPVLFSTTIMDPSDLDLRPGEMARSTLEYQIQCCDKCGYCTKDIRISTPHAADIIVKPDYKSLLRDQTIPPLARKFLCWAKIAEEENEYNLAFNAALNAAWVCDDQGILSAMIDYRNYAVYLINKIHTKGLSLSEQKGIDELVLSDILRRSGRFEESIKVIDLGQGKITDPLLIKALFFEKDRCDKKDTGCYSFESIDVNDKSEGLTIID